MRNRRGWKMWKVSPSRREWRWSLATWRGSRRREKSREERRKSGRSTRSLEMVVAQQRGQEKRPMEERLGRNAPTGRATQEEEEEERKAPQIWSDAGAGNDVFVCMVHKHDPPHPCAYLFVVACVDDVLCAGPEGLTWLSDLLIEKFELSKTIAGEGHDQEVEYFNRFVFWNCGAFTIVDGTAHVVLARPPIREKGWRGLVGASSWMKAR